MTNNNMIPYDPLDRDSVKYNHSPHNPSDGQNIGPIPENAHQMPYTNVRPPVNKGPIVRKKLFADYKFGKISLPTRIVGVILILPLYFYLLGNVLLLEPTLWLSELLGIQTPDGMMVLFNAMYDSITAILGLLLLHGALIEDLRDLRKRGFKSFIKWWSGGYLVFYWISFAGSLLQVGIQTAFGVLLDTSQNQELVNDMTSAAPFAMIIVAVIIGPITEELVFRGIIFRFIRPLGAVPAIAVSSLVFGFIHVSEYVLAGDTIELLNAISYVAMGIGFGILYEKRRNLAMNMVFHITHNAIAMGLNALFTYISIH